MKQEHDSYITLSEKWVSACKLKAGDKVLLSDGKYGIIVSVKIEELEPPETTYNFEVEDYHTYYAVKSPFVSIMQDVVVLTAEQLQDLKMSANIRMSELMSKLVVLVKLIFICKQRVWTKCILTVILNHFRLHQKNERESIRSKGN